MRVFAVSLTWEVSRLGGSGCAIMGLASIGGHCPLCDLMQLREGVLILGPSLRCCCNTQNPLRVHVWLISSWQTRAQALTPLLCCRRNRAAGRGIRVAAAAGDCVSLG